MKNNSDLVLFVIALPKMKMGKWWTSVIFSLWREALRVPTEHENVSPVKTIQDTCSGLYFFFFFNSLGSPFQRERKFCKF